MTTVESFGSFIRRNKNTRKSPRTSISDKIINLNSEWGFVWLKKWPILARSVAAIVISHLRQNVRKNWWEWKKRVSGIFQIYFDYSLLDRLTVLISILLFEMFRMNFGSRFYHLLCEVLAVTRWYDEKRKSIINNKYVSIFVSHVSIAGCKI